MKKRTTIWLDDCQDSVVTVNRDVTDLDEASRILGYADYQYLLDYLGWTDPDDSPINFKYED